MTSQQHPRPPEGIPREGPAGLGCGPHADGTAAASPGRAGYQSPPTRAQHGGHGMVRPAHGSVTQAVCGKPGGPATPR